MPFTGAVKIPVKVNVINMLRKRPNESLPPSVPSCAATKQTYPEIVPTPTSQMCYMQQSCVISIYDDWGGVHGNEYNKTLI